MGAVFQRASELGNMREMRLLCEEGSYFQIRIDSFLQAPEKFQDQAVSINNRGVALLRADWLRLQNTFGTWIEMRVRRRLQSTEHPFMTFHGRGAADHFEKRIEKIFLLQCVGQ